MKPTFSILALIGLALLATPAIAKPGKGKGNSGKGGPPAHTGKGNPGKGNKGNPGKGNKDWDHPNNKHPKFVDKELNLLRDLFAPDNRKSLPPGLRKNLERGKPLPPGWQKKVAAGQVIDAGWLDLMTPVSYDDLPGIQRHPGTRMYYHDNRLVRVNPETRMIIEVVNLLTR